LHAKSREDASERRIVIGASGAGPEDRASGARCIPAFDDGLDARPINRKLVDGIHTHW
jgi:hypothetical protein